jgi:hypothetical protein
MVIKNATENLLVIILLNTELKKATIKGSKTFDIILANIIKDVYLDNFSSLVSHYKWEEYCYLAVTK